MGKEIHHILNEYIKTGRPPKYKTPLELWEKAMEYFEWKKTQTFPKVVTGGRDLESMVVNMPTPMTVSEFAMFCGLTTQGLNVLAREEGKFHEEFEGTGITFFSVITCIKEAIRQQKIDGASAGAFQHNIIAMEMGLKQIKDIQTDGKPITGETLKVSFEDMSGDDE